MNKKGHVILGLTYCHFGSAVLTMTIAKCIGIALVSACVWHIPAWEEAKKNHTEAAFQSQEMFPQELFDKLPGGTPGRLVGDSVSGNAGNFNGGISKGI